jgi:hypothetical protein
LLLLLLLRPQNLLTPRLEVPRVDQHLLTLLLRRRQRRLCCQL